MPAWSPATATSRCPGSVIATIIRTEGVALDVGVAGRTGRDHVLADQRAGVVEVGAVISHFS